MEDIVPCPWYLLQLPLAVLVWLYYDEIMKYFPTVLLVIALMPFCAIAHTSDQRYESGMIIDLSTAPVAPWVGEKVGMSFVFRDASTGVASTSVVSASFVIDALMREHNKTQETIFESPEFAVTQGGFVTDYVFQEVGTYDMHVQYTDSDGITHETGFRKQVRRGDEQGAPPALPYIYFGTALCMLVLGYVLGRKSHI
jgi:hypothetical protein